MIHYLQQFGNESIPNEVIWFKTPTKKELFSSSTYIHSGTHCHRVFWKPKVYMCSKRDQTNSCKNSPCQLFWMEPLAQEVRKLTVRSRLDTSGKDHHVNCICFCYSLNNFYQPLSKLVDWARQSLGQLKYISSYTLMFCFLPAKETTSTGCFYSSQRKCRKRQTEK